MRTSHLRTRAARRRALKNMRKSFALKKKWNVKTAAEAKRLEARAPSTDHLQEARIIPSPRGHTELELHRRYLELLEAMWIAIYEWPPQRSVV